jgi:hypothetical protein
LIFRLVVAGNECIVHAHPRDTLREIVDIAFTCTKHNRRHGYGSAYDGEDKGWQVRDNDGRLLDESMFVADLAYNVGDDKHIWITLPAGTGA